MAPLPKRKLSQGRRDRRRSHMALRPLPLVECTQCHEMHRQHHVCPSCGSYNGTEVIKIKEEKPSSS